MEQEAAQYAAWGWHVFPLKTGQKTPRETGGFHTASTDLEQIRAWWKRWPKANIGLATGVKSGVYVVDLDTKDGKDGGATWAELCRGHPPIDTVEALTPSGGRHLYFSMPEGVALRNTEGMLGSGVDTRGEGGYVVAPPSTTRHGSYEWELTSDPNDTLLASIPQWLLTLLQPRTTEKPEDKPSTAQQSWEHWLAKVGDGDGHEGFHGPLRQAAAAYVGQYHKVPIDRDYLIWKLRLCAERSVWKREREELQRRIQQEIPQLVDSALKKFHAPATSKVVDVVDMSAQELMKQQFKPLRWYAAGLLHEGMVLFGGKSKRGKSWVALNLAVSIATGGNVFGHYEVPQPSQVLYCALEDGPRRTQRRLKMIADDADLSRLKYAFRMPPLEDGGLKYIADHIEQGFEVVIVDVLAHVEKAGKNGLRDYHEVYQSFAPLLEMRSKFPFALIMITHLRKAESEEVFDNLHGSVAYQGAQDALWVMERKPGEDNAHLHLRDKDAEDKVAELQFDGAGIWTFVGEGDEHQNSTMEGRVISYLREEGRPRGIKDILAGLDLGPNQYSAMRQRLFRMVSKGLVLRTDRGLFTALPTWDDDERFSI